MNTVAIIAVGLILMVNSTVAAEQTPSDVPENVSLSNRLDVPYDVDKTLQSFSKTVHGGVQHLVAKSETDTEQIKMIQDYLIKLVDAFRKGDFSEAERLHGKDMPGLNQLKTAKADEIYYEYKALAKGGQIHYSSEYPNFVQALHEWFDAQAREHANSTVPEHEQHHKALTE
jgi:hypothetical protein